MQLRARENAMPSQASANFPPPGEADGCSSGCRRSTFVLETIGEDGLEGDRVNALYIGMLENRIFLSTCGIIQLLCIFASEWNKMLDL